MSTDTDSDDGGTEKINVRVPESLLDRVDSEYRRRGYASRSEAIRDAIRDWVEAPEPLSEETIAALEESREQVERGETVSAAEARERLGLE